MKTIKKRNAYELKRFMAALMVLDHLDHIPGLLPPWWAEIFHALTRCVAPFFAYMAVEGFLHTRSRLRYNLRLFLWAAVMAGGNAIVNALVQDPMLQVRNNIFRTLAMGVLVLNIWGFPADRWKWNPKAGKALRVLIGVPVTTLACVLGEGSLSLIPFMLICYGFRDRIKWRDWLIVAFGVLLLALSYQHYESVKVTVMMWMYNSDGLLFLVLPFLHLYNGERGPNGAFQKYFFYVFYPAHLWLIAAIGYLLQR